MNNKSKAPNFLGLVDENKKLELNSFHGSYLVIYFYPKDKTSGCTIESQDFRDFKNKFAKKNCKIVGVSRDSIKSHKSFVEKEELNFPLISDPEETMCNAYEVMKEKSMYGRKYMGIERSTFLIDPEGLLVKEWRGVKVPGHVEEVYNFLCNL
ncbi:MAG: peroxiredoxin [Gammaproteobacteria bacterium]|jgi:peroxiredoxin Q/BCP|nr:peroxiredoxin [Gammaproteobacteria bacterium]